jgi:hypothetical protein
LAFLKLPDSQLSTHQKKSTCRWTNEDNVILVNTLIDERAIHAGTTGGFKTVSWTWVEKALEGSELVNGSKAKDVGACKS